MVDGLVVTVDTLVEGIHWNERLSPRDVGYKAVAVSVSDLAAMGAEPTWMVLALAISPQIITLTEGANVSWLDEVALGVGEASTRWSVPLVGGDTVRSPGPCMISVTMGGKLTGAPLTRRGARAGDDLWVTGFLGLAGSGYVLDQPPAEGLDRLRRPNPPLAFALDLARRGLATAAMDVSDGLASDLPRLCRASGVGAVVHPDQMPSHAAIAGAAEAFTLKLSAGDDYELLFSASPSDRNDLQRLATQHGVRISRIGLITGEPELRLVGMEWPRSPFSHFSNEAPLPGDTP